MPTTSPSSPVAYRLHLLLAIDRAQKAGNAIFAQAILAMLRQQFPEAGR